MSSVKVKEECHLSPFAFDQCFAQQEDFYEKLVVGDLTILLLIYADDFEHLP